MSMCGHFLVLVGVIFILCSGDVIIRLSFCLATPLHMAGKFHRVGEQLHRALWRTPSTLEAMLLDVPGCQGLQYMSETQLNELGLRNMGYNERCLLIRHEYLSAFNDLTSISSNADGSGGVVVTGQPGIGATSLLFTITLTHISIELNQGKSCFIFYVLLRRLCDGLPTALEQLGNVFLLFDDTGVQVYDAGPAGHFALEKGVWALTDSSATDQQPCRAFYRSGQINAAWVVQATSPARGRWYEWQKELNAHYYVMDFYTWDELRALGFVFITLTLYPLT